MLEILVVGVAALLTSILSAVAGLGGGVVLLLVVAQFVAPTVAIPIQGAIQLVSNGSRAALLRQQISWPVVGWASILMFPASLLGVAVATSLPDDVVRLLLAGFVLVLAWRPALLKASNARSRTPSDAKNMLIGVGAASGFLNSTVGASGPVTSPFLRAVTASHKAFVATAGMTQVLAHVSKLIAFSAQGWSISDHLEMIIVGVVGVMIGSWIGTRLLDRASEAGLDLLFKVVLTALATRIIFTALT
ncbi:MAG: putative membrane protein YfcA [Thermoproteota archaeon]|jgi:uncharacterized membrane protein YfcA